MNKICQAQSKARASEARILTVLSLSRKSCNNLCMSSGLEEPSIPKSFADVALV